MTMKLGKGHPMSLDLCAPLRGEGSLHIRECSPFSPGLSGLSASLRTHSRVSDCAGLAGQVRTSGSEVGGTDDLQLFRGGGSSCLLYITRSLRLNYLLW